MTSKPNVATLYSSFASGSDATLSLIEVSISPGIPTFSVIGLYHAQGTYHNRNQSCLYEKDRYRL